ncbi:MAG: class I SAM-dependent methyltransferase [Myxococcota bacterium]
MKQKGIMGESYAQGRLERLELIFRYKYRALVASRIKPEMTKGGAVLDLGAADGLTLLEIQKHLKAKEALGIELSAQLATAAQKNGARVIKGDVQTLPSQVKSDHYDLVTALAVLEHLEDPLSCLFEVERVLKPGGILVVSAPNPFWDRVAGITRIHKEEEHHQTIITPRVFKNLVKKTSLEYKGYKPFMLVFTAFLPYLKIFPNLKLVELIDFLSANPLSSPLFVNQLFIAVKPL